METLNESHRAADEAVRAAFISSFFSATTPLKSLALSPYEKSKITQVEQTLNSTKNEEELDDNLFFPKLVSHAEDGNIIGSVTGIVQTNPENLLAYTYLTTTHQAHDAHIASNGQDSSKYPSKTIHVVNDHHNIHYTCRKLPPPLKPRDWLTRQIFHKPNENTIKYYSFSIEDNSPFSFTKTTLENIVRGELSCIHEYERLPHNQTSFTLRLRVDIKGSVPKKIANMGTSGALDQVYRAYKYFQRDEEIDELKVSFVDMK